jgi:hypothetical protein
MNHGGDAPEGRKREALDHLLVLVGAGRRLAIDALDAKRMPE